MWPSFKSNKSPLNEMFNVWVTKVCLRFSSNIFFLNSGGCQSKKLTFILVLSKDCLMGKVPVLSIN